MATVLLLLPVETYRAGDFLAAARGLGIDVVVAATRRQTLAGVMGHRCVTVDLAEPEDAARRIAEHAGTTPLDAVVAVDDAGVLAAALAAERLELAHNRPEAVAATRDKGLLRERLTAAGLAQPAFRVLAPSSGSDAGESAAAAARAVGLPCVVKPVGLSASRGVIRADTPEEARAAAERAWDILCDTDDRRLVVEQFVGGAEIAVEALLRAGTMETLAVFDKPDPLDGPYFEETLYVTPSRHDPGLVAAALEAVAAAARAVGLREGPLHAEVRLSPSGPVVLELAARSIGGLCARSLRFGAGVSLEEVVLRHAAGLPLEGLRREHAASGVMMLPIPHRGVLREVRGQEEARAVPGVTGLEITVPRGHEVAPLPEGDRYLGFAFARGLGPDEVERALRQAHARLDVVLDPLTSSRARSTGSHLTRDRSRPAPR